MKKNLTFINHFCMSRQSQTTLLKCLLLIVISCWFTSCNMMMSSSYNDITIKKSKDLKLLINDSLIDNGKSRYEHKYLKTGDTLMLTLINDERFNEVKVPAIPSSAYIKDRIFTLGIPFNYILESPKRQRYPKKLYVETAGNSLEAFPYKNFARGDVSLNFNLPILNYASVPVPVLGRSNFTGFLGFGVGLQYHFNEIHSFELAADYRLAYQQPAIVPIMQDDNDYLNVASLSARYHYAIKRWDYSLGLHYNQTRFTENTRGNPNLVFQNYNNVGIHTSIKYRLSYNGYVGVEYIPTFINLKSNGINTTHHMVSLGFTWRLHLKNRR